jgi:hypothetical protein
MLEIPAVNINAFYSIGVLVSVVLYLYISIPIPI